MSTGVVVQMIKHDRTTISWAALAWRMASGTLTLSTPYSMAPHAKPSVWGWLLQIRIRVLP